MEVETKQRLDAVLARESDRRKAVAAERAASEAKERAREAEKQTARDRLPAFRELLEGAIREINDHLSGKGIGFAIAEGKKADAALAQIYVPLLGEEAPSKDCQIVLNVSAFGLIQPVFLIPHSGRVTAKDVNLTSATSELLIELMIDFLDQVLANADKKGVGK
jgi:hypothetical protein